MSIHRKKRWKNCFLHEFFCYICRICRKKCKTFKYMACFPESFRLFSRVGARIYNIHIVIIGLDFDMVCAPYTLNNLYLSFEFVVFSVFHFLGGSFIQHFSIIHIWIMMEVGEPNKNTAHCLMREKREENDCASVCEREFVYNTVVHFSRPGCVSFPFCYIQHYAGV